MLEVKNLSKSFGKLKALDDVTFEVGEGEVFGIIGQNGAGKSTFFRCFMNYFEDYIGSITYKGKKISEIGLKEISYLPEERALSENSTVEEQIKFFACLNDYAVTKDEIEKYVSDFEVKGKSTDKIKTLSKGNMQKVQIICALIYKPKIVILDEPFSGLDPYNIKLLKEQIIEKKTDDMTILFSSHDMSNVEEISDRLIMLKNGKKVIYGDIESIKNNYPRKIVYIETEKDLTYLNNLEYVTKTEKDKIWKVYLTDEDRGEDLFKEIVDKIGYVKVFSQSKISLDEIFTKEVAK